MSSQPTKPQKFKDGTIVVVTNGPCKGQLGLYNYRGPQYDTAEVVNGCSTLLMEPANLEQYDQFKHGILEF